MDGKLGGHGRRSGHGVVVMTVSRRRRCMYVERDMLQVAHRLYIDSLIFFFLFYSSKIYFYVNINYEK